MDSVEIQKLYKDTFGSVIDDQNSFSAFIELLKRFNVIGDNEYFWQKQGMSSKCIVESFTEYVPMFEYFDGEDKDERAYFEIKKKIAGCNTIYFILSDEEQNEIKFVKEYNSMGLYKWLDISNDGEQKYDDDYIISEIIRYIKDGYSLEIHGKYADVCKKNNATYFNAEEMKRKLRGFYKLIFGSNPVLKEDWPTFLEYVEKAGIITGEQKIMLDEDAEDEHKDKTGEKEDGDVSDKNE